MSVMHIILREFLFRQPEISIHFLSFFVDLTSTSTTDLKSNIVINSTTETAAMINYSVL